MFGMSKSNAADYNAIVDKLSPDILKVIEESMSDGLSSSSEEDDDTTSNKKSDASDKIDWSFRWFR